jgi:preprotein translocase subunit SecD
VLNRYPLWKTLLIVLGLAMGGLYALPNLYPDDLALQISGASSTTQIDQSVLDTSLAALKVAEIDSIGSQLNDKNALIRFANGASQLRGKAVITAALGEDYMVAFNLAPNTPEWLMSLGAKPMKLGLDLRGGVHFLLEVDMVQALAQRLDAYISEIKTHLRSEKIRYRGVEQHGNEGLQIKFASDAVRANAKASLAKSYRDFVFTDVDQADAFYLRMNLAQTKIREIEEYALSQNLITLRNRVNELGVAEPLVQRQGRNRIVVQLPGVQDTVAAKRILGATANLEFRLEAKRDATRSSAETHTFRSNPDQQARLEKDIIITGNSVASAQANFDEHGLSQVNINLDGQGGKLMNRVTRDAIKRRMAVLFVEHKSTTELVEIDGQWVEKRIPKVQKGIISLATIQSVLGNSFRITGLDNATEASELALLLRAGSLAAPIYFVEERTIGPSLGQQNIDLGVMSVQIGLILVLLFMLIYYSIFGLVANLALTLNLMLVVGVMSLLGATLTLPGIAGIVLTVGMAVDSNVLIFSRIKEELRQGMPSQSAIHAGYERAFTTILDANITTLLVAVILYAVGTGPVKGFAVTLCIGIVTSMFTAIMVTRAMVNGYYGRRKLKQVPIWPCFRSGYQVEATT